MKIKKMMRSISFRVYMVMTVIILFSLLVTAYLSYESTTRALNQKGEIILKNAVNIVYEQIQIRQIEINSGMITEKEAQEKIKAYLRSGESVDLGENGYFIITDTLGNMLVHPSLEGQNTYELMDYSNPPFAFVQDEILKAMNGGGFTYYKWHYRDNQKIGEKMTYARFEPNWGWVVMASSYMSDYNQEASNLLFNILPVMFVLMFLILLIGTQYIQKWLSPLSQLLIAMEKIQNGDYSMRIKAVHSDEIGQLTEGYNEMARELEQTYAFLITKHDDMEALQRELYYEKEHYKLVLLATDEIFWEYKESQHQVIVKPSGNVSEEEVLTVEAFIQRFSSEDQHEISTFFNQAFMFDNQVHRSVARYINREGQIRWHQIIGVSYYIEDTDEIGIAGSLHDVHNEYLQRERIEFYAFHDGETGLFNTEYLLEQINGVQNKKQFNAQIIVVGISQFERLSKVYGDNVMSIIGFEFSAILQAEFSQISQISLLKNGQFGILIQPPQKEKVLDSMMHQINQRASQISQYGNLEIPFKMCYGGVLIDEKKDESASLLNKAVVAFELAEEQRQYDSIYWFSDEMDQEKQRNVLIEQKLRKAIVNNHFRLVYQPQVSGPEDQHPKRFEALLRWHDPELGFIRPDVFIPTAEAIEFIGDIGRFVIENACQMIQTAKLEGHTIHVAVNASFKELLQADYVPYLMTCCETYDVNINQIHVEITESAIAEYIDSVEENLNALKQVGFEIHMDDFGTGYSSLNQLGRLPVSVLKIDKSFVWALTEEEGMKYLTELIISVAHKMGMYVIAEGIETQTHYELLDDMKCDLYQGYYFSKPIEAEALMDYLNRD